MKINNKIYTCFAWLSKTLLPILISIVPVVSELDNRLACLGVLIPVLEYILRLSRKFEKSTADLTFTPEEMQEIAEDVAKDFNNLKKG